MQNLATLQLPMSVQLASEQDEDGIYALGKAHMHSPPSLRSFPNVVFETVPMFIWLTMAISGSFKEDCLALPLSMPLSSRQSMVVKPLALYPQVVSQAPEHFRSSKKQATCEGCFACQYICSVISLHSSQCEEYEKVLKRKEKKYTDFCLNSLTNFQPSSFYLLSLSIIDGKCSLRKHTKPNH